MLNPEYCRAKARACEERANETSDFIMMMFWLWLACEWHGLAKGRRVIAQVDSHGAKQKVNKKNMHELVERTFAMAALN